MQTTEERLRAQVEEIARSDSPSLTYTAALPPEGSLQTATVWFAPTENLDLLTLSSPTRMHSRIINACATLGHVAAVSGGMRLDGQRKSSAAQHGLTFNGYAERLHDPEEIEAALARFLTYETFQPDELDKYLNHPTEQVPAHNVYVLRPTHWKVFDNRLGADNSERLVGVSWPPQ